MYFRAAGAFRRDAGTRRRSLFGRSPRLGQRHDDPAFGNAPIIANFAESLVPETATWALMIGGFGLAGVRLRTARTLPQR